VAWGKGPPFEPKNAGSALQRGGFRRAYSDVTRAPLPPLLVVVGPTASGKTELAVELAERLRGEVVSADSVQIYRQFDIGTGKPSPGERARARHHLVDVLEPNEPMDAGRWAERAELAIDDIRSRGRVPIVCGGSYLWIRALLYGLADAPHADPAVRARHRALAESEGRAVLHEKLTEVDPASAERLSPNDFVRVSRALEVFELTGERLSAVQERHGFRDLRHAAKLVGITRSGPELDERIERRARAMLAAGFVAEVERLIELGHGESRAMGSVGYRQIREALASDAAGDVEALADAIRRATRIFARRQRTWLRRAPVEWLEPRNAVELALASTGGG
jgi:tRNA dimethylallyltransferase